MVAKAKGADIKVVASNIVEQISVVALPDLAESFDQGDLAGGFARFEAKHGRKPVIATFPKGSVPDTVLSYWALEGLGLTGDEFDVVHQGAAQVQQALLTGAVDGAAILEPVVSAVTTKIADARVIAAGSELFKDQPGAVLVMRESLLAENPEWARKWVAEHVKATQALANNAPGVVDAVGKYVGGGRLPKSIVEKAILQSSASFVADPTAIIKARRLCMISGPSGYVKSQDGLGLSVRDRVLSSMNWLLGWLGVGLFVALWKLAETSGLTAPGTMPDPFQIPQAIYDEVSSGRLWPALLSSLTHYIWGLSLGESIGRQRGCDRGQLACLIKPMRFGASITPHSAFGLGGVCHCLVWRQPCRSRVCHRHWRVLGELLCQLQCVQKQRSQVHRNGP